MAAVKGRGIDTITGSVLWASTMSQNQVDYLTKKLDQVIKRRNISNGQEAPDQQFSDFVHRANHYVRVEEKPVRTRVKREENRLLAEIDEEIRRYVEEPAKPSRSREAIGQAEFIWPGICMSDIARDTGLTLGGVSRIFNGLRKAKAPTLKSIANLYTDGNVQKVVEVIVRRVVKDINRPMTPSEAAGKRRQQQIRVVGLYESRN